jgi:hypothetical protein
MVVDSWHLFYHHFLTIVSLLGIYFIMTPQKREVMQASKLWWIRNLWSIAFTDSAWLGSATFLHCLLPRPPSWRNSYHPCIQLWGKAADRPIISSYDAITALPCLGSYLRLVRARVQPIFVDLGLRSAEYHSCSVRAWIVSHAFCRWSWYLWVDFLKE